MLENSQTRPGDVVFVSRAGERRYLGPGEVVCARSLEEAPACMARIENALADGKHVAGFVAYEAAPAFNPFLATHPADDLPLLWFGIYDVVLLCRPSGPDPAGFSVGPWTAEVGESEYFDAIRRIRELIAAGDTYQVNYTFPMTASFEGNALAWFGSLCRSQRTDYAAFLDLGRFKILSMSPELFFRMDGGVLKTRPMKGTRPRGRWCDEDFAMAAELASSEKDRAENVMIVDLLRNDMGRISETGSVQVARLFEIERYETVWQMTSSITSRTSASFAELFSALFPSGSVTGAPKIRTMQIIRDFERFPRGIYCGAIGWASPTPRPSGFSAEFNVAIRTITLDLERSTARYCVGGGITWDSTPMGEYAECFVKAATVTRARPAFELLESVLFDGDYFLLQEHLDRLKASAAYFGYPADIGAIRCALREQAAAFAGGRLKVRLSVARDGSFRIESEPAKPVAPVRLGLARDPVDDQDVFLFHKTTHRAAYDHAKASRPDCDDVLLWNRRGELTESTTANLVLRVEGEWLTPPVASGLLAGTMRAHLLALGEIREAVLTKDDLACATVCPTPAVRLINSVRKWIPVTLCELT